MEKLEKIKKYTFVLWYIFAAIFTLLFLYVFEEIIFDGDIPSSDYLILDKLAILRTPFLTNIMKCITSLGNVTGVVVFLMIVFLILYLLKKRKYIFPILISSVLGEIFVFIIKLIAQRERPSIENALITEKDFSFPSGHTMIAMTVYGLIFYFLVKSSKEKWQKILLSILGVVLVGLIGFSRLYLGVHWPTDVLASYLLGSGWVCFVIGSIQGWKYIKRWLDRL